MAVFLDLDNAPEAGALTGVEYVYFEGLVRPVEILLIFAEGRLHLAASEEDDQLLVVDRRPEGPVVDAAMSKPWRRAIGRHCLWSWSLRNHTGHSDAVQLLLAAPPEPDVFVQMLVEASQIEVLELTPVQSSHRRK